MNSGKSKENSTKNRLKGGRNDQNKTEMSCKTHNYGEILLFNDSRSEMRTQYYKNGMLGVMGRLETQMKIDAGPRVIRPNYRSVTGWVAGVPGHDHVAFESTLERDCAYLAMFEPRITNVVSQPYTILYTNSKGKQSKYTPDFELTYLGDEGPQKALLEVKPLDKLEENKSKYYDRFMAMSIFAQQSDTSFHAVTENQIRTYRINNVKSLYARVYDLNNDHSVVSDLLRIIESRLPMTMREAINIRGTSNVEQAQTQTLIWALLAGHEIFVNLDEDITGSTLIHKRPLVKNRPLFFLSGEDWSI